MRAAALILALAVASGASAADDSKAVTGKWVYSEKRDPITDKISADATLRGDNGWLVVTCREPGPKSVFAMLASDAFLEGARPQDRAVITRVNDDPAKSATWRHSQTVALMVDNKRTAAPAAAYSAAMKMAFRLTTYQRQQVDIQFQADGDQTAVKRVFSSCGQAWPAP